MPETLRFAISIPQFVADGAFDPGGLRTYLARATALGFDSAWTLEQVLGKTPVLGRPGSDALIDALQFTGRFFGLPALAAS